MWYVTSLLQHEHPIKLHRGGTSSSEDDVRLDLPMNVPVPRILPRDLMDELPPIGMIHLGEPEFEPSILRLRGCVAQDLHLRFKAQKVKRPESWQMAQGRRTVEKRSPVSFQEVGRGVEREYHATR